MLDNIHAWAAKSKLNMAICMAVIALVAVFAKAYLPADVATIVVNAGNQVISPTTVQ